MFEAKCYGRDGAPVMKTFPFIDSCRRQEQRSHEDAVKAEQSRWVSLLSPADDDENM